MFPAPSTSAIWTPRPETSLTCAAIRSTRSGSVPYSSGPINASPEIFRRTRLKLASDAAIAGTLAGLLLLAHREAREARDAHVLAGLRGHLGAELLDRLAVVAVGANVL